MYSCTNQEKTNKLSVINLNDDINSELIINTIDELKTADKKHNVNIQIEKSIELSNLFFQIHETDQALKYLNSALLLSKQNNENEQLNVIYHKLGDIYLFNNNYDKAKKYFSKAYELSMLQNEGENVISDLMKLGFIVHKQDNIDSARFYYRKILKIVEANNTKEELVNIYIKLAELYEDEGLFKEAKILYKQVLDTSKLYNIHKDIDLLYLNLGKLYSGQNKFDSANYFLLKSDSIINLNNNTELKTECNYWLLRNNILKKSNNELVGYLDYNKEIRDSINLYQNEKWQRYAEFNYKLGKKEAKLVYLQEKNYNQKTKFILLIITFLLLGFVLILLIKNKNKKLNQKLILLSKENEIKELKEKQLEAEAERIKLELEIKNKEVLSNSILLLNKNEMLENLKNIAKKIDVSNNKENKLLVDEILGLLRDNTNQDNIWNDFKIHFEEVHQDFFNKLKDKHPDLSENDTRLCAYIKIGMQNQEIANIAFISPESVRKRKQRLREKLNLESGNELVNYIDGI